MYDNDLITKNDERIISFFKSLDRATTLLEKLAINIRPSLHGGRFLTDKEVSQKLRIGRRTLQDYRSQKKIPYYQLGGKTLYREDDIEKVLEQNYFKSFK